MRKQFYILFVALISMSCNTVEKMVEKGQYDQAFAYSVKHLAGKKNKKTKYVTALEEAYIRLNDKDLTEIDFLMKKGSPASWDRVYYLYEKMEKRQELVIPLMPLESSDGFIANFEIRDYTDQKVEVANLSALYHYDKALEHLNLARKGDKREARRAMTSLNNIDTYFTDYKDSAKLKNEAKELGTEHIAVEFITNGNWFLSDMAMQKISSINVRQFDTYWENFHHYDGSSNFDNYVVIELENIDLGREREFVSHNSFTKEIEDGYDIIEKTEVTKNKEKESNKGKKDKDKDVEVVTVKDKPEVKTTVVKKQKFITVRAEITEITREKESNLYGRIKVFANGNDHPIYQNPIVVNFNFFDDAVKLRGDRRALPKNFKNRLDEYIEDFPNDFEVIDELAYHFTSAVANEVNRYDFLYD